MAVTVSASGTKTCPVGTVTITNATPGVVSYTAHGLAAGDAVVFAVTAGGSLPTGLTAGTTYYVSSGATLLANSFVVSDTQAHGIAGTNQIATSSAGSGTFSIVAESVLYQSVAAASYVFEADLTAMTVGDVLVLTVYKTVLGAGASVILFEQAFIGTQGPPTSTTLYSNTTGIVPPLAAVSKSAVASIPASTGLTNTGALSFTISQTAGVARAVPYSVNKFA